MVVDNDVVSVSTDRALSVRTSDMAAKSLMKLRSRNDETYAKLPVYRSSRLELLWRLDTNPTVKSMPKHA
jgi:hypothetical protein